VRVLFFLSAMPPEHAKWIQLTILVLIVCMAIGRVLIAAKDGQGNTSSSLTGMQITTFVIFAVVMIDTFNDRSFRDFDASSIVGKVTGKRGRRGRVARASGVRTERSTSRSVIKEKYWLLAMVFLAYCVLFLLSHRKKDMRDWTVKGAMAIRGNDPYEHIVDETLVAILRDSPDDPDIQDFFIRGMLAKKGQAVAAGGESGESQKKEDPPPFKPPSTPFLDDK